MKNQPNCAVWNLRPQPGETVEWSGGCKDGKIHGEGRLLWRYFINNEWVEETFTGSVENGMAHGYGVAEFPYGKRYEGGWRKSRYHGQGVLVFANGDRYEGDFVDGSRTGRGIYTFAKGSRYEGDFVAGKRTGRGVYEFTNGNRYEGDFC